MAPLSGLSGTHPEQFHRPRRPVLGVAAKRALDPPADQRRLRSHEARTGGHHAVGEEGGTSVRWSQILEIATRATRWPGAGRGAELEWGGRQTGDFFDDARCLPCKAGNEFGAA